MKTIAFQIDDKLAEKFELAMQLTGDDRTQVAEQFVRQYLEKALHAAAAEFSDPRTNTAQPRRVQPVPPVRPVTPSPAYRSATADPASAPRRTIFTRSTASAQPAQERTTWGAWGKAIPRIPRWAKHPQQNNHKILRAYFELQKEIGKVTIDALRNRCSDPQTHPHTFVPHFDNNFAQMKFDNGNSHGKVFEEQDGIVLIWDKINDTLMKYRDFFL